MLNACRIEMEERVKAAAEACQETESFRKQVAEVIELPFANADLCVAKSKIIKDAKAHTEMLSSTLDAKEKLEEKLKVMEIKVAQVSEASNSKYLACRWMFNPLDHGRIVLTILPFVFMQAISNW